MKDSEKVFEKYKQLSQGRKIEFLLRNRNVKDHFRSSYVSSGFMTVAWLFMAFMFITLLIVASSSNEAIFDLIPMMLFLFLFKMGCSLLIVFGIIGIFVDIFLMIGFRKESRKLLEEFDIDLR